MKANADRYLKGMPISFVFFINFILTLYHLFWLSDQTGTRFSASGGPLWHCGTSKKWRCYNCYLHHLTVYDNRPSLTQLSRMLYFALHLLRQLLMLRGFTGVHTVLINRATRHQIRGDKGNSKLPDGLYMSWTLWNALMIFKFVNLSFLNLN